MLDTSRDEIACLAMHTSGERIPLTISQLITIKESFIGKLNGIQLFKYNIDNIIESDQEFFQKSSTNMS